MQSGLDQRLLGNTEGRNLKSHNTDSIMYKRRKYTRRTRRTRRRTASRARSKSKTTFAKKVKKVILKTAERKAIGTIVNNANAIAVDAFNVVQLTNVASVTGTSSVSWNTKTGQEYYLQGFNIKMMISNVIVAEGDPINPIYFRVMLLEGRGNKGTIAPVATNAIFQGVDLVNVNFSNIANKPQSMWYPVDKVWYKTIYNKVIKIGNNGSFDTRNLQRWIKCQRKIKTLMNLFGEGQQNYSHYLCFWAYDPAAGNVTGATYDIDYQHQTLYRDP